MIVYKTNESTTPLANAQFIINGKTIISAENGYTEVIELPISDIAYDLLESKAPAGYIQLTNAVNELTRKNPLVVPFEALNFLVPKKGELPFSPAERIVMQQGLSTMQKKMCQDIIFHVGRMKQKG